MKPDTRSKAEAARDSAAFQAKVAIRALLDGKVDNAIGWLTDARESAYRLKAALNAEKVAAALAADTPLAGAPVTTKTLPRAARQSKNGHGGAT